MGPDLVKFLEFLINLQGLLLQHTLEMISALLMFRIRSNFLAPRHLRPRGKNYAWVRIQLAPENFPFSKKSVNVK